MTKTENKEGGWTVAVRSTLKKKSSNSSLDIRSKYLQEYSLVREQMFFWTLVLKLESFGERRLITRGYLMTHVTEVLKVLKGQSEEIRINFNALNEQDFPMQRAKFDETNRTMSCFFRGSQRGQ